jgi:Protein of unknown function (DUF3631)
MTLPPPTVCRRIRQLHAMMGSPNAHEADVARARLNELLSRWGQSWNDLPAILAATDTVNTGCAASQSSTSGHSAPTVNVLDLVLRLIELHVAVTSEECMGIALWVLHTYVFDRFAITPRLALLSPVRGCGKTTLLVLLELLTAQPYRSDNITAAAVYHRLARRPHTTLLIDEGDNLGLLRNSPLRAVFNSGHRRGGTISRFIGGWDTDFNVFSPLAVTAIGSLPLPLLHRSLVTHMQRHAPGGIQLQRLDEADTSFPAAREEIKKWAATCSLACDPEMPSSLYNRTADNWRPLLAIADNLGHGEAARAAAIALCSNRPDEDPGVVLLGDIRTVFLVRGIDRGTSEVLVEELLALGHGFWHDCRGPHDDRPPRKLTQGEMARLLRNFEIRPRTVWQKNRRPGDKSSRGYYRDQFEAAWRAYCPPADTPTQPNSIRHLRRA